MGKGERVGGRRRRKGKEEGERGMGKGKGEVERRRWNEEWGKSESRALLRHILGNILIIDEFSGEVLIV